MRLPLSELNASSIKTEQSFYGITFGRPSQSEQAMQCIFVKQGLSYKAQEA
jgi:hypothetical protein